MIGYDVAENLYAIGEDPEEGTHLAQEPLVGFRDTLCRFYPNVKRNAALSKISETAGNI